MNFRGPGALSVTQAALASLALLMVAACGKNKDFATKTGSVASPPPEPEAVSKDLPREPARSAAGYQAPRVSGSGAQIINPGGKLGDPVDPEGNADVTTIENGDPTKIGLNKGPVNNETAVLTCPAGLMVAGACVAAVDVMAWRPTTAASDSSLLVSTRSESCNETGDAVCSLLKSKATALGYKVTGVAFRGLNPGDATQPAVAGLTMALQLCHGSRVTAGNERITDTTSSCSTEQESIWGLRNAQDGTLPLFRWEASGAHVLSLSSTVAPGPGFVLNPAKPILHVLPRRQ